MAKETDKEKQQELMFKLQMYEQQIQQIQQQMEAVEHAVIELNSLNLELDELKGKKGKEIFASVGRGIFAKAKLLSEDLMVDIGEKTFVKKNIPNTKKILEEQIKKLKDIQKELQDNLEKLNEELTNTFMDAQKEHAHN